MEVERRAASERRERRAVRWMVALLALPATHLAYTHTSDLHGSGFNLHLSDASRASAMHAP